MDERHRSDSRNVLSKGGDSDTDDIDLSPLHDSGATATFEGSSRASGGSGPMHAESEADVILIAHPDSQRLPSPFPPSPSPPPPTSPSPPHPPPPPQPSSTP